MRVPRAGLVVALVALALALAAPQAQAGGASQIVAALNQQRAANGIPAGIVERPDWSNACALHNRYMELTGTFGHFESSSSPFYTAEGAWAANRSVLASGLDWAIENPFEDGPIHLAHLLDPALVEMGADYSSAGYTCATTTPGTTRPRPTGVVGYSYPGNGVGGVRTSERASESPYVPGDFVGLPQFSETGPYLMAFLDGPEGALQGTQVTGASLSGPGGPVPVAYIGTDNPNIGQFIPRPMTFIIPRQPLAAGTTYVAAATFVHPVSAGDPTPKAEAVTFSFTTAGAPPPTATPGPGGGSGKGGDGAPGVHLKPLGGNAPRFSVRADEPFVNRVARVKITHYSTQCKRVTKCSTERSGHSGFRKKLKAHGTIDGRGTGEEVKTKITIRVSAPGYPVTTAHAVWRR
ncbi:MAG: CAP domain-containing protein [Solirubrobacterales bacterium]